ncbi:secretin N-terminal domain-containing protein [Trinickia acidisoli]|uniref:secretin N-terminal domain-containing protein n=1 Tax=Trinickia acidisoli TaxID=2767482 RepID=UPI001A8D3DDC|nr:secretin N-terminal domain-containing protein [Trinickia acidisoli]
MLQHAYVRRMYSCRTYSLRLLQALLQALLLALLCSLGCIGSARANANANAELDAPYAFQASEQAVLDVLRRFATDHGLALRVETGHRWQTAKLDGWTRAPTGRAFLEQLAHAYHFSWFIADRTLYLNDSLDSSVERIALNGIPADSARTALAAVGIYDPRFGWGELAGQDAVLVNGPRAYRALVRRYLASHAAPDDRRPSAEPMIFPLRFAQAADTSPPTGAPAVRPGIATLLRQLLAREIPATQPSFILPAPSDPPPPLPGTTFPLAQRIGGPAPATMPALAVPRLGAASAIGSPDVAPVGIVADAATNSIIVWADRGWRSAIQQLVNTLDRPSSLVSMDILVIESDLSTVATLSAASESVYGTAPASSPPFEHLVTEAIADHRARLLNRQTLVGRMNRRTTLSIGGEVSHADATLEQQGDVQVSGRSGQRGDRLDLTARIVPSEKAGTTAIAVDIDLLMAQPTGLPGQTWANSSSIQLDTAVTLESGAPPRLIASYPIATTRSQQRAIFISAKAL